MDLYRSLYDFIAEARNYSMVFWLLLPVYSGSLKRIDYPKQICLAQFFPLNVLTALTSTHFYIFILCHMLKFPSIFINYALHVKNWNRLQNAADLGEGGGGYFISVTNTKCYIKFDFLRVSHIRVRYWYEIRDILIPIFHVL